jgi:hypothetical protein
MVSGSCSLPPRWPPQCSCVVIESSFDPGERLQAPGSLWFYEIVGNGCIIMPANFFSWYCEFYTINLQKIECRWPICWHCCTIPANLDKSYFAIFGLILFSYITVISNSYSFHLISQSDTFSINRMTMMLKFIIQCVINANTLCCYR